MVYDRPYNIIILCYVYVRWLRTGSQRGSGGRIYDMTGLYIIYII